MVISKSFSAQSFQQDKLFLCYVLIIALAYLEAVISQCPDPYKVKFSSLSLTLVFFMNKLSNICIREVVWVFYKPQIVLQ